MLRKSLFAFLIFFLILPGNSFAGSFGKDDPSGVPGQWYVGDEPSYISTDKHPILFVHGLNSSSNTWWNENDMYATAYNNGYETSFIDLYPTKNMWDNGYLLAEKLRDIYNHFGEKVVVVAHSKGGIDTQSALVHYGAHPYVERVITLSTPHHGSQLADLAYSSWAGWLSGILGSKNDATYSLQTGYMSYFRNLTDRHADVYQNPIYTFGGTKWGSFGSSLYWGGLYLRAYGQNDGAVTVSSSRLPYATEIAVDKWNHSTIKEGSSTFYHFDNYLKENVYSMASFKTTSIPQQTKPRENAGAYITGGEFKGNNKIDISVEEDAEEITVDFVSDKQMEELVLTDPNGQTFANYELQNDTEFFNGAYHHTLTIANPSAGKWKLTTNSNNKASYLLQVSFTSKLNDMFTVSLDGKKNVKTTVKDKQLKVKTDMTLEYYKNGKLKMHKINVKKNSSGTYKIPHFDDGMYNITINLKGKYGKEDFQRTIIKSIYIDEDGIVYE
ncbi:triacylglycerol lipase [Salirhabdus euzebyi]|uniref:Triacylglycerol lipase n=1 Tax=Salirhabdus euzebyi TaxID=394506 RepID=A0A841PUZ3_9BACI|nr:hypothetical protein [Salirhabdus euzebyi]MBB6452689.1 triacylglycerol lipase [Salirhabdus euzebyi]